MKKNYIILSLSVLAVTGFSQNRIAGKIKNTLIGKGINQKITPQVLSNGCDTTWHIVANDTAGIYGIKSGWGYVSGNNSYNDIGKAEKILASDYTAGYQLVSAVFFFAKAVDGANPTTMNVKVWSNSGSNGLPGTQVGSSANLAIADMATGGAPTLVTFSSPIPVSGDFYLGLDGFVYDAPAAQQDTVAIYQSTNRPTHPALAYDEFNDGSWVAESDPTNWANSSDFYIIAILCTQSTTGEIQIVNPGAEAIVYPNPSTGNLFVSPAVSKPGNVTIYVYDVLGKLVTSYNEYTQTGSTCKLDMSAANAGVYFVSITTDNKTVTKKVTIQ